MALADPVYVKQHDLEPVIFARLSQGDGSLLTLDPDNDVVHFIMRKRDTSAPQIREEMEIVNGDGAEVLYEWVDGDTDTPGVNDFEFEVTKANGKVITVPTGEPADPSDPQPDELYYQVIIFDDLDNP